MDRMKKASLTTLEAGMLVCGCNLGTGILAVPYISQNLGVLQIILAVAIAFAVTSILHLMVADLALSNVKRMTRLVCPRTGKVCPLLNPIAPKPGGGLLKGMKAP